MTKNILVIDDDPLVIRAVTRFLKSYGYNITAAQSGQEAIEKIKILSYDLIISDIRMPGMDGLEMLKIIRESSSQTNREKMPAVIMTGYAGVEEAYRKAGELGVTDYVYKPFELDEFITVVKRNLELPLKHERAYPRAEVSFPVEVTVKSELDKKAHSMTGKTVDLSEDGIGLILDNLLSPQSIVTINVNSFPRHAPFQLEAIIVWAKPIIKDGRFRCGLHFLLIEDPHLSTLKEILFEHRQVDDGFISLTNLVEDYLKSLKEKFDKFDAVNSSNVSNEIDFITANKKEIFAKLDNYFAKVWDIVKDFERDKYIVYQNYFQQRLRYLALDPIATNRHVYTKPLGYAGDYIMMNYIYDYYGDKNYIGNSLYEKLINNYTCNIPVSCSNIKRKQFLKEKIMETLKNNKKEAKILSIACGPARELTELLEEGKIANPLLFKCLDFEKKALEYIEAKIKDIELTKKQFLTIEYICRDITSIIRDKRLKEKLNKQNLIYAFGIFDYLSNRMASRLTAELFNLLDIGGKLIICNISLENISHRAYYELFGEWNMVHRTKEEMLTWVRNISTNSEIKFEPPSDTSNYLFMSIKKL